MEDGTDYEILETNLQPFFWRKVKDIIRQNKKDAFQEFLFAGEGKTTGKGEVNKDTILDSNLLFQQIEKKIQNLQKSYDGLHSQVNSLQDRILDLEASHTAQALRNKFLTSKQVPLQMIKLA